jgi:hypothetical protein
MIEGEVLAVNSSGPRLSRFTLNTNACVQLNVHRPLSTSSSPPSTSGNLQPLLFFLSFYLTSPNTLFHHHHPYPSIARSFLAVLQHLHSFKYTLFGSGEQSGLLSLTSVFTHPLSPTSFTNNHPHSFIIHRRATISTAVLPTLSRS